MKKGRTRQGGSQVRWLKYLTISLTTSVLLAGCVATSASAQPSASGSSSGPSISDAASASISADASISASASLSGSTSASESQSAVATAAATPTPPPTPEMSIGPLAASRWTGITWTSMGRVPELAPPAGNAPNTYSAVTVYGWSRGYVGFQTLLDDTNPGTEIFTMVSTSSPDAVHWTPDRPMDVTGLTSAVQIASVVEGPSGLLAVGRVSGAACGGPPTVIAMWTSPDGLTWSLVHPPANFASAGVLTVDGGKAGFIASGMLQDGVTQALWISVDGRSWGSVVLPKSVFGEVVVQGASSFAGGYVVSGAIRGDEGCGGPRYVTPSLWWSADGAAWTRATLAGAAPATDSRMAVSKVSDHALMAVANEWNEATQLSSTKVWVTSDGRTWRQVGSPSPVLQSTIRTDGRQGFAVSDAVVAPPQTDSPLAIAAVDDDLSVTVLPQTGDVPMVSQWVSAWNTTVGPAGILATSSDYSAFWLGAPVGR